MALQHRGSAVVGAVLVAALSIATTQINVVRALPVTNAHETAAVKPGAALTGKKKAKGTLQVVLTGTGSYTVTGKGFRKTAQASKSFKVAAGAYKISAPGATVSRGRVKVKAGKKVTVTVAFPPAPGVTPPPVQTPPPADPTTPPPPPPPALDTTPPGKVTGLAVGTRTTSSIPLAWTNPGDSDLAEVIVRRALGATAPATPTAGVGVALGTPKASSVTDNGLTADAAYSYAVFTRDASNNTNPTPATVTTSTTAAPDATPPGKVTGLAVGTRTTSSIALAWTNPGDSDLAEVIVRRALGATAPATPTAGVGVALGTPKASSVTDNGLTADAAYSYAVFTRDASNNTNPTPATVTTSTTAAPPGAIGAVQRVSTSAADVQGDGESFGSGLSPDGTQIVFTSEASNLVPGDTNAAQDVFVKTLATGAIQRVSTDAASTQANDDSYYPQWSPDGTQIAFSSRASNLVVGDTNYTSDVFVKTLASGAVQRVSVDAAGTQAIYDSYYPQWSPDGTQIAFTSWSSNLVPGDTNGWLDVFVKTLATGAIQRVSTDAAGTQADDDSNSPRWSPDGTRIVFSSSASNLVPGDTNDTDDVFVKTVATGAIQRVSTAAAGAQADGGSYHPQWSPDGTMIAFDSYADNLVPGDTGAIDVFVKTLASGAVQRVSTDAAGTQANRSSSGPQWSPDGTQIAFESDASNLVTGDTNDAGDVFVKTLATGAIQRVSTAAAGTQANRSSYGPQWSPDGTRIVFSSWASNLVTGDTNDTGDVFVKTLP